MIEQALEGLSGVYGNAAFLLHEQGAAAETVRNYLQHYGLLTEQEAHKRIEFLSTPAARAYIFTYYWGKKMADFTMGLASTRLPIPEGLHL